MEEDHGGEVSRREGDLENPRRIASRIARIGSSSSYGGWEDVVEVVERVEESF